jgi:hypothetical protein
MSSAEQNIQFRLFNIKTEQFAILEEFYKRDKPLKVQTSTKFGFNIEKRLIGASVKVSFESDKNPFIIIEVICHFEIESEKWMEMYREDKIIIPKGFAAHLMMITVGTARGVLYNKLENTEFNNISVPLINVSSIFNSDIVLKDNFEVSG